MSIKIVSKFFRKSRTKLQSVRARCGVSPSDAVDVSVSGLCTIAALFVVVPIEVISGWYISAQFFWPAKYH